MNLFSNDWGIDNSPKEEVEITTMTIYLSEKESKEFKQLLKKGIKKHFGENFQKDGNITDYLIFLLKKENNE